MNAARLVAVLERRVHIFELGSMRLLHSLSTPRNPHGADSICAVFGCACICTRLLISF